MNIQKTLSAVLSVSMLFTSVGAMPVGNAYAEDDDELSWYDDHYEEIMVGNMYYHAPDKVIYKVGEQFDVTGEQAAVQAVSYIVPKRAVSLSETEIISAVLILLMNLIFQASTTLNPVYTK